MALSLQITKPDNSKAEYFRINVIQYDTLNNDITIILGLYKDFEARLASPKYFEVIEFNFKNGEHPFSIEQDETTTSFKSQLYQLIKTKQIYKLNQNIDFSKALDV